jgi:uncharacterized protein YkwD
LLVTHIHQRKSTRAGKATKALAALMLCAGFAFLLPSTASTHTASTAHPARIVIPMSLDHMASEVVYLVNLERAQHSLPPLRVNTRLVKDAKLQATQIAETGILDHVILTREPKSLATHGMLSVRISRSATPTRRAPLRHGCSRPDIARTFSLVVTARRVSCSSLTRTDD